MDRLEQRLLNDFQRDFPLVPRPFLDIGVQLGMTEAGVIAMLGQFVASGKVSRIGAAFVPGRIGAAILATLAVPEERLLEVAEMVSAYSEVNHNYQREHLFNLWFVVTGPDRHHVDGVVREIGRMAGCGRALSLPMVEPYHADLGFNISGGGSADNGRRACLGNPQGAAPVALNAQERALAAALQEGLPLVAHPYAELGRYAGLSEDMVISTLAHWLGKRIVNRLGVIVRHHELGFSANAMVVWDVPDTEVRAAGLRVATEDCVTLCYRRLRCLPEWRYNLYCMIHGVSRDTVRAQIEELAARCGLRAYPREVLFSSRRFKQCGARYVERGDLWMASTA